MLEVDLTDRDQVVEIIKNIEAEENRERKRLEWKSYQVFSGDQRTLVTDALKVMFPTSAKSMYVSNINVFKKVVDKIAKVYSKTQPMRQVNESDDIGETYEGFDQSFKTMDSLFNRHKYLLGWVRNNLDDAKKFDVKFLAPYLFDLIIDPDLNKVVAVILSYPDKDLTASSNTDRINSLIAENAADSASEEKRYSLWTETQHVNVISKSRSMNASTSVDFIIDEENMQGINPLGRLPFVWITAEKDIPEYPTANSLPTESVNINLMNSDLLTGTCRAAVPILKTSFPQGSKINVIHEGHSVSLALPQSTDPDAPPTTAEYINASPPLEAIKGVLFDYASAIVGDHGIEGFSITSENTNFQSGFDRALAQAGTNEVREENIIIYTEAEKEIFEIIKVFDAINGTRLFSENDELNIIYPKPEVIQSEAERLGLIKIKKELGLIEEWEKFIILNPNMTEKQAREKLKIIESEKKEKLQEFMNGTEGNQALTFGLPGGQGRQEGTDQEGSRGVNSKQNE